MQKSSRVRVKRKGQVTIPVELRTRMGLVEGVMLDVEERGDEIVLKAAPSLKGGKIVGKDEYKEVISDLDRLRRDRG
ncbi:MAG: AbrB/MazE/SpoVT family DNA-binding domain-containing protein [Thaumarchaeota archaeon]|nr:AbrB/MazE/SpoVT family DNA-binding domain-containing protein [Nitrososphaerota archaeon]